MLLQRCDAFLRLALNLRTFSGNKRLGKSFGERKLDITTWAGDSYLVLHDSLLWLRWGLPIARNPPIGG